MSMFLPFALVTSLVMLAMTVTGVYSGEDVLRDTLQPIAAAESLHGVLGKHAGRIVFDLGLMAMTCSAISTHMVVCGFTLCEMLGLEYTKTRFRIFALCPVVGVLGVVTRLPFWFPVAASAICFAMLPIAYLLFYLLNNKESYLGEGMIKWPRREFFNIILVVALTVSVVGAMIKIKTARSTKWPNISPARRRWGSSDRDAGRRPREQPAGSPGGRRPRERGGGQRERGGGRAPAAGEEQQ